VQVSTCIGKLIGQYLPTHTFRRTRRVRWLAHGKNLEINTDFSRQWISQRCPVFVDHELAERHEEEPAYRLTEFGEQILNGEAEYEELNETNE